MNNKKDIIEDLEFRGLINQSTNLESLRKETRKKSITLYVGFDPTADSLQVGNLLPLLTLKRFQEAGHNIIVLAGGATGLVGDPSGKSEERRLNPEDQVKKWVKNIKGQIGKIVDLNKKGSYLVNNYDWFGKIDVISFLRDVGKHFSVSSMIAKDSVKSRIESGISFTEFSYQVLQAYDFLNLFEKYNCRLQIGGSDQWGNISAGVSLVRRVKGEEVYGLTIPLVTKSDGSKFGKSAGGKTIWLDPKKTSPYEFYQFWFNVEDEQVIKFLKYFTFLSEEKIKNLEKEVKNNPSERKAQRMLAREVTGFLHGEKAIARSEKISEILFYGRIKELKEKEIKEAFDEVSSYEIKGKDNINLVDVLVEAGVVSSKRQAREDIKNGAIYINGEVVNEERKLSPKERLYNKYLVIRRGKRKYHLLRWL
jgi:tyrosyl-tRNA synthetase